MKPRSKRFKWVVLTSHGDYFLSRKPKRVRGGYLLHNGRRIVGTTSPVLWPRQDYVENFERPEAAQG